MASPSPPPPPVDDWSMEVWVAIVLGGSMLLTVGVGLIYMAWRRRSGRTLAPRPRVGGMRVPPRRAGVPARGDRNGAAPLFADASGQGPGEVPSLPLLPL